VNEAGPPLLVLGLGNDILGDDAVGLLAARRLAVDRPPAVEVVEAAGCGLDLLDHLVGRRQALLLDAIVTGQHPPGSVLEVGPENFLGDHTSPHAAGLPEALSLARCLGLPLPEDLRILALEIEDAYQVREGLSPSVERALPAYIQRARMIVEGWCQTSQPPPGWPHDPEKMESGPGKEMEERGAA